MSVTVDLFTAGIGFDLAAAALLARSLVISPAEIFDRSSYGGDSTRHLRFAKDRATSILALAALFAGFTLQGVGYALTAGINTSGDTSTGAALLAIALGLITFSATWGAHRVLQPRLARTAVRRGLADHLRVNPDAGRVRWAETVGPSIGMQRGQDEEDEAFVNRVLGPYS